MHQKSKTVINIIIVTIAIIIVTSLCPWWYSFFDTIPLRIFARLFVQIVFILIIFLINNKVEKKSWRDLGFKREHFPHQILNGVIVFAILSIIFICVPILFGVELTYLLPSKGSLIIYSIIYNLVFVGFSEEIVFRGYYLDRLYGLTNSKIVAIILSSIIFGLWHFILSRNFLQVIVTSLIGFILGFSKMHIKNCTTFSVSLAHGLYDTLLNLLSWYFL